MWILTRNLVVVLALVTFLATCSTVPKNNSFQTGYASWYGEKFHGRLTASGEKYNMYQMTAAHPSLPFGTRVLVKSKKTKKTVEVRINDRGPFTKGRIIDLSYSAAQNLNILELGYDEVELIIP